MILASTTMPRRGVIAGFVHLRITKVLGNRARTQNIGAARTIRSQLDSGRRVMPCVRLECVEFDEAFYQKMVRKNDAFFGGESQGRPGKRRRMHGTADSGLGEDSDLEWTT